MVENSFIALVEDDPEIRSLVAALLEREGFGVGGCRTVAEFERLRQRQRIDLAILDVMLPGEEDGLALCRRLRATDDVPVLMVTAKGDDIDRIIGLEVGADDYLPKPFNPRELVARVRAILRRTRHRNSVAAALPVERYRFLGWRFDAGARSLADPDGNPIELTGGEHDLLLCFVQHPQHVLNRDQLLDWTRGRNAEPFDRTIDVQLSRLRAKLGRHPGGATLIRTVRGGGYAFAAAVERD